MLPVALPDTAQASVFVFFRFLVLCFFGHFSDGTCGYALFGHFSDGASDSATSATGPAATLFSATLAFATQEFCRASGGVA